MWDLEDPEIGWQNRTGYPSWMRESRETEYDEDAAYEEERDAMYFEEEWE